MTVLHISLRSLNIDLHSLLRQVAIRSMHYVLVTLKYKKHLATEF